MVYSLMTELNKIIDVVNNRKLKFVIKNGILKAMWFSLFLCIVFALLGSNEDGFLIFLCNTGIKILVSIIPGIIWGLVDYQMYKDIVNEAKKFRITNVLYIFLYGFLGWGVLCGNCNISYIPYDQVTVISAIVTLPVYGIVLGIISKKVFNTKLIRQLYIENIKGKHITKVQRRNNVVQMK